MIKIRVHESDYKRAKGRAFKIVRINKSPRTGGGCGEILIGI